jgi:flagellar hook-basal body complex protein FliE
MANGIQSIGPGSVGPGSVGPGSIGPRTIQQTERGGFKIPPSGSTQGPSFADTLEKALGQVSDLQANAQDAISAFLRGEPVEVHEVMAATEEAGIALEMLIEVRNKLTEAYRSIINMQN